MYNQGVGPTALAATGFALADGVWLALAAFAVFAAVVALLRVLPPLSLPGRH